MIEELPTIAEIVHYWTVHEEERGLGVDWSEAGTRCWRCGYKSRLQRCHIVPRSRGGTATVDNLVLLCRRCHREAPNVPDQRFMWIWLRATCVPFYDLYWTARGAEVFHDMFGRPPFSGPEFTQDRIPEALALMRSQIARATVHWGEDRMNPATIASILALVEEKMTGRKPVPPTQSASGQRLFKAAGWLKTA